MLDVIMISQGQGLACRKQHRVVSDAVELKVKGWIEILESDIKKKLLLFIASCSSYYHGTFIFFFVFLLKIYNNYSNFL